MNEAFPFSLIALLGVLLLAAGLIASSISGLVYGARRGIPVALLAVVYAITFTVHPPAPVEAVRLVHGMNPWDALRFLSGGLGIALVSRDYWRALCELAELRQVQQGRGEL